jgi:hypothetical protein
MADCDSFGGYAGNLVQPSADRDHDNPKKKEYSESREEVFREPFGW